MLKTNRSNSYKMLAKKTEVRECFTYDDPLSELVVDFRSRLFMYIRTVYFNRPLKHKIDGLFMAINDPEGEKKRVFKAALAMTKMEVRMMRVSKVTYVFASSTPCSYKQHTEPETIAAKLDDFRSNARKFRCDMLNISLLDSCISALENYVISDFDNVCTAYRGSEWLFVPGAKVVVPREDDMFESDRTCARLAQGGPVGVLSEDFDCVALFGASFMVKKAHNGYFEYVILKDVMETFKSATRRNLVEKCIIIGTDYNFGLNGVGPVKVGKIDDLEAKKLCHTCLSAQSIRLDKFLQFFRL